MAPKTFQDTTSSSKVQPDIEIQEEKEEQKAETFTKPKMVAPQSKPVAPSSSISGLLEGLKESGAVKTQKSSRAEKRQRKQHVDNQEVRTLKTFFSKNRLGLQRCQNLLAKS